MKRALLSVSDKSKIVDLAKALSQLDYELVSTGGTASLVRDNGLAVTDVAEITQFPEALGGRVKTLHPVVHAGILARRDEVEDMNFLDAQGIKPIDLVVINLYPFKDVIMKPETTYDVAIENIDIGGPTMLRAAAKNAADVSVLCDPADYDVYIEAVKNGEDLSVLNKRLQAKVFRHTAYYDSLVANYLSEKLVETQTAALDVTADETEANNIQAVIDAQTEQVILAYDKVQSLRYGENPHQHATYYRSSIPVPGSLPQAQQLQGKELSYNNIQDASAALEIVKEFTAPTVVAVKHANPCGVASAKNIETAWQLAYEADSVSIFGGIVAANREVTKAMAEGVKEIFIEILLCPAITDEAMDILQKRKNLRILVLPDLATPIKQGTVTSKAIYGGLLIQDVDTAQVEAEDLNVVTDLGLEEGDLERIRFAMQVVKHVKSNAICLTQDYQTVGIGPGQTNRITAVEIATKMAGEKAQGSIMASDAFFPFDDCVRAAAAAGVRLIVQPGGSIRDEDSIKACNELGIAMVFTGKRHFLH